MRPNPAFESTSRSRNPSNDHPHPPATSSGPTTFFLASESDLSRRGSTTSIPQSQDLSPVRTLKETIDEANRISPTRRSPHSRRDGSRRRSTIRPRSIEQLRPDAIRNNTILASSATGLSTPLNPSSQEPSLPNSPKSYSSRSLARSDDELTQDGNSSQAIESGDEDSADNMSPSMSMQDSAPQLIMPSIKMPSRRPFTDNGKQLGKLKILVTGSKGCGKTSLVKSIVQLCEDIVHVDPLTSTSVPKSKAQGKHSTPIFHETYASTRPYPAWWSDTEESRILKRRKSMGDTVLERNICFVDAASSKSSSYAAHYIEQQLLRTINCANQANSELTGLLSGKGGSQVDLVLYLVSHDTLKDDCDQIQQLSRLANVVPLISKCDIHTQEQIREIRNSIEKESCAIRRLPMTFGSQFIEKASSPPFTVACVNGPDYDNMDASLLMSSEYIQPLLPSELQLLVDQIFQPEVVAYLRHTAAKKLTNWYNSGARLASVRTPSPSAHSHVPSTLNSPLQASLSASGFLIPLTSELSLNTSNSFALARVADHTTREERLAQMRLSKWASDLQLSLQRERERYESIARAERAVWLVDRMGEEIRDGQLVRLESNDAQAVARASEKGRLYRVDGMTYQVHDPLGLLRWQDAMRSQTWLALQVVGSFGVVGGLALWITKTWGVGGSLHQWAQELGIWHE